MRTNFLVQTVNGEIVHDFSFALMRAKEYYAWLGEPFDVIFVEKVKKLKEIPATSSLRGLIPVGEVGFVSEFLRTYHSDAVEALRPLNVPEILFPFAGRKIVNVLSAEDYVPMQGVKNIYAKSLDIIKDEHNGPFYDVPANYQWKDFRRCQVSELVDFVTKWRVFVFHGQILYAANYSGDPLVFPGGTEIRRMVDTYTPEAPVAYTLDVAVDVKGRTVVVECHRFFSCGLYGFNEPLKYPKMLSQAWFEIKNFK